MNTIQPTVTFENNWLTPEFLQEFGEALKQPIKVPVIQPAPFSPILQQPPAADFWELLGQIANEFVVQVYKHLWEKYSPNTLKVSVAATRLAQSPETPANRKNMWHATAQLSSAAGFAQICDGVGKTFKDYQRRAH
jgi:hypothetical protein